MTMTDASPIPAEFDLPIPCEPTPVRCIWGGTRLSRARGLEGVWGTSWEVSAHEACESRCVIGGVTMGLGEVVARWPREVLGEGPMLRAGYLDTAQSLSVQVHPDEDYAQLHGGDHGKTETWYIVDCAPGATLVAGTRARDADELAQAIDDGRLGDLLVTHEVHPGDLVHIPAGCLHALGADILAAEVGSDSDTTYRFWDYGRVDERGRTRELHLDHGLAVVRPFLTPEILPAARIFRGTPAIRCDSYEVSLVSVDGAWEQGRADTVAIAMVVAGRGRVGNAERSLAVAPLDSFLLVASMGPVTWHGDMTILVARARADGKGARG